MNNLLRYSALVLFIVSLASCSNNDNDDNAVVNPPADYFPLSLDNFWNYDVTNRNLDLNETQNSRDSVYVASANGNLFGLAVNGIANGTMNTILTQMSLMPSDNRLSGTGSVTFPFEGLEDFQIGVNNVVFYDTSVAASTTLSTVEGVLEQMVEGLPITATYTLRTVQGSISESMFLNNENYTNVIESGIILELTITTDIEVIPGSIIEVLILDTQDVLDITNYYAEDIGLVRSEADISYVLEDFSQIGITLPIAGSLNASSLQELGTYSVEE
ncbi:MAG: hypothetical protein KJP09_10970 [Bacteroidia bacterium]|nr:hypothetical protein [Bacteroidia bacterium]MBT8309345.1 hypothetical protein [Bacteroidia bacterium]NND10339.1 hypothetical protein [Flavobacteriaceae bacterium]NNK27179.1 hypothetical protein [Flavobacteriaceae bacterium]NNL60827.1 hypothetical protein [Flavobacteriaceae bacterium]